jgi:hypothetical protein
MDRAAPTPRAAVDDALRRLLLALPPDVKPQTVSRTAGGLRVTLTVSPAGPRLAPPDVDADRRQAVLGVARDAIRSAGRRVPGADIWRAVRAAGHDVGYATFIRTLADLVATGHLVNARDAAGYGLPADGFAARLVEPVRER